jgi:HD-GYP domain-containing protein (c-di-GMP phosphodiesterase class II)
MSDPPPIGARIIAVADAYDAMVTDRPYRKGRLPVQAYQELKASAPKQFDPHVVEALGLVMASAGDEMEAAG